jgi:hypothetical protein
MKLCIPSMKNEITKDYIFLIFCNLKIGRIGRIIENIHFKNPNKKRILIDIDFNKSEKANYIKNRLSKNEPIYIVYDQPWFWKIVLSNK